MKYDSFRWWFINAYLPQNTNKAKPFIFSTIETIQRILVHSFNHKTRVVQKALFWSNNKGFCSAPRWPIQHTKVFAYSQNQKVLIDSETKRSTVTYIHIHQYSFWIKVSDLNDTKRKKINQILFTLNYKLICFRVLLVR